MVELLSGLGGEVPERKETPVPAQVTVSGQELLILSVLVMTKLGKAMLFSHGGDTISSKSTRYCLLNKNAMRVNCRTRM